MKNLKKILAIMLVLVMAMSLTGCMTNRGTTYTELTVSETEKNPDMGSYNNDFDGIVSYMRDSELIAGEGIEMSADFIGAKVGQKFAFTYSGQKITCEIYEYDLDNLTAEAQAIIDSVKTNGYFTSLDSEVKAVVSNSGKFLMIYVNGAKDDDDVQQKMIKRVNEKFASFSGQ